MSETCDPPACYVVTIAAGRVTDDVGLPVHVRDEVASVLESRAHEGEVARELNSLVRRFHLPGIAVVAAGTAENLIAVPEPLSVPIEPVELDERHPTVEAVSTGTPNTGARQSASLQGAPEGRALRVLLAIGFFVMAAASVFVNLDLPFTLAGGLFAGAAGAVMAITLLVVFRWQSGTWLLGPGGVIVRRLALSGFHSTITLFRPQDSVLMIEQGWPDWHVRIYRGYRPVSRWVSRLECTALLAAWQSPLEPPDLTEFVEPR
jgi:hypothetical protein